MPHFPIGITICTYQLKETINMKLEKEKEKEKKEQVHKLKCKAKEINKQFRPTQQTK